ncbi:MAG: NERD domain-containing protein [Thermogemmatispora sp.]|nr:NERD domain-containing protein [Thermogemmatispora sp.]
MDYPHQMERHVIFCPQSKRLLDRGVEGELLVVRYLFDHLDPRMVGDYRVLVNYYCPQHGLNALEIDLLVITTFGVFLLEVKNWLGHIDAYDDAWQLNGEKRDNIFGSILHKQHCVYSLMKKFQKLPLRVSVSSLVVSVEQPISQSVDTTSVVWLAWMSVCCVPSVPANCFTGARIATVSPIRRFRISAAFSRDDIRIRAIKLCTTIAFSRRHALRAYLRSLRPSMCRSQHGVCDSSAIACVLSPVGALQKRL